MAVEVRLRPVSLEKIRMKVVKIKCGCRDWTDTEWVGVLTGKYECNENGNIAIPRMLAPQFAQNFLQLFFENHT